MSGSAAQTAPAIQNLRGASGGENAVPSAAPARACAKIDGIGGLPMLELRGRCFAAFAPPVERVDAGDEHGERGRPSGEGGSAASAGGR
jgi:hypothetical protein